VTGLDRRKLCSPTRAALVADTDHEIGRVIQEVEDEGKLDNTLIIYVNGDNVASSVSFAKLWRSNGMRSLGRSRTLAVR